MSTVLIPVAQTQNNDPDGKAFIFIQKNEEDVPTFSLMENTLIIFLSVLIAISLLEYIESRSSVRKKSPKISSFFRFAFDLNEEEKKGPLSCRQYTIIFISFVLALTTSGFISLVDSDPTIISVASFFVLSILLFSLIIFLGKVLTHEPIHVPEVQSEETTDSPTVTETPNATEFINTIKPPQQFKPGESRISKIFFYALRYLINGKEIVYFTAASMVISFALKTIFCLVTNRKKIIKKDIKIMKELILIYIVEFGKAIIINYVFKNH